MKQSAGKGGGSGITKKGGGGTDWYCRLFRDSGGSFRMTDESVLYDVNHDVRK